MNSTDTPFFTLLRVMPNPASGEAVVVGLVLFDGERYWHEVSARKLKLAFLLARRAEATLQYAVRQLVARLEGDTEVRRAATAVGETPNELLLLSRANWEYLSRYSNGILRIDAPAAAALFPEDNPEDLFRVLFSTLVDSTDQAKRSRQRVLVSQPVKQLIQRVERQVHTNVLLTPKMLPDLFFNLRLDCIGMNGALIGAHSLPLEQYTMNTLQQHASECRFALKSLTEHYKPKKPAENLLYIIADEPDAFVDADKHKFWRAIRKESMFRVIATDEAPLVAERIEQTHATTFLVPEVAQREFDQIA